MGLRARALQEYYSKQQKDAAQRVAEPQAALAQWCEKMGESTVPELKPIPGQAAFVDLYSADFTGDEDEEDLTVIVSCEIWRPLRKEVSIYLKGDPERKNIEDFPQLSERVFWDEVRKRNANKETRSALEPSLPDANFE